MRSEWLIALAVCLITSPAAAQGRSPTAPHRAVRVFAPPPSRGGQGATVVATPAIPALPDLDKLQMTALSLPNSGVKQVSSNFRLSASRPIADGDRGTLSVLQATTQPEFGRTVRSCSTTWGIARRARSVCGCA
jgi:hypothetical protein